MKACDDEIKSHTDAGTRVLVPRSQVPTNKKIIGSTWAFDVKRNAQGGIAKFKGRFCAQGFSQKEGHDYYLTYSNTVRYDKLRLILVL